MSEQRGVIGERVNRILAADPTALANPFPVWNELRQEHPVLRSGSTVILSRHDDVRELVGDNNLLYSRAGTRHAPRYEEARTQFDPEDREAFDDVLDIEFAQLVRLDPPDHQRLRRTIQPPFSMRKLNDEMRSVVIQRVDEMLGEAERETGVVDFKRIAYLLPLRVLGDLLGIPLPDLDRVQAWAQTIAANKFNVDSGPRARAAAEAYTGLHGYIEELIGAQRAGAASSGLVAAIVDAEDSGHVEHAEAIGMLALMLFAGHETTTNLLAIGTIDLLRHRAQWESLCADPSLAPAAVEELLRFVTPVHYLQYVATTARTIRGVTIDEGDTMIGVLAAANRDPAVFDEPNTLCIARPNSKDHLSLGFGPHFCIGAGLARMEAAITFAAMAERYPGMTLENTELEWGGSGSFRTPIRVPIRL